MLLGEEAAQVTEAQISRAGEEVIANVRGRTGLAISVGLGQRYIVRGAAVKSARLLLDQAARTASTTLKYVHSTSTMISVQRTVRRFL